MLRTFSRKTNNKLYKIMNNIKFRIESFTLAKIIILTGVILNVISLFMNHISSTNILFNFNAFSRIFLFSAVFSIFSNIVILFLILSFNKKEILKKITNTFYSDYVIITFFSIISIFLVINNILVIKGLIIFSAEIFIGKGAFLFLFSEFIILVGALLLKKEYINDDMIILNEKSMNSKLKENNIKLPF